MSSIPSINTATVGLIRTFYGIDFEGWVEKLILSKLLNEPVAGVEGQGDVGEGVGGSQGGGEHYRS